jgi:glycosyltransferase involved in cell wall biosynthesis
MGPEPLPEPAAVKRVIHIVDRLDRVNFGIWNAALATTRPLRERHGLGAEIWYPAATREGEDPDLQGAVSRGLPDTGKPALAATAEAAGLDPEEDVIVSHGCWRYPTRWGYALRLRGFAWLAVPHGMLEGWSVQQKRLRKALYFRFYEGPRLRMAQRLRAVGRPEWENLRKQFGDKVIWIPNGVPKRKASSPERASREERIVLFLARLHHKKGLLPLLEGWRRSRVSADRRFRLVLAGPDDGELARVRSCIAENLRGASIELPGPVYGEEKFRLLERSRFYVLPSHSEGFPTSVLEAMQFGLVPLISMGCNFPDVFEKDLGLRAEPDPESIRRALDRIGAMDDAEWQRRSRAAAAYIDAHYTNERLGDELHALYRQLLGECRTGTTAGNRIQG